MTAGCEVTGHAVSEMHVLRDLLSPVKAFWRGTVFLFIYLAFKTGFL